MTLKWKTREQNRNNKRTEIERFDWFIERIQTRVAFGWLGERSGEKLHPQGGNFILREVNTTTKFEKMSSAGFKNEQQQMK